jgi:hypothetical protein
MLNPMIQPESEAARPTGFLLCNSDPPPSSAPGMSEETKMMNLHPNEKSDDQAAALDVSGDPGYLALC